MGVAVCIFAHLVPGMSAKVQQYQEHTVGHVCIALVRLPDPHYLKVSRGT